MKVGTKIANCPGRRMTEFVRAGNLLLGAAALQAVHCVIAAVIFGANPAEAFDVYGGLAANVTLFLPLATFVGLRLRQGRYLTLATVLIVVFVMGTLVVFGFIVSGATPFPLPLPICVFEAAYVLYVSATAYYVLLLQFNANSG